MTNTDGLVSGSRVMVSAAGSGIGRAIAEMLSRHGARVHACDVDPAAREAFSAANPEIPISACDVADFGAVERWTGEAVETLGGLDGLVNNAGIGGPTGPVDELDPGEWRRTIDVDLNGMFYVTRQAVPHLRSAGGGAIVNISSIAGKYSFPGRSPYVAAKWAVVGFSRTLARELGSSGIRVNCIQPGNVEGPRIERVIAAKAAMRNESADAVRRRLTEVISMGRFVSGEDVADLALFLLSPQARNVSGQVIAVDGDTQMIV